MMKLASSLIFVLCGFLASPVAATQISLDSPNFYSDPSVTVAPDGSSATLAEDSVLFVVLLSNDPGLGDPEVIIAAPGVELAFELLFDTPVGNLDFFQVTLFDADDPLGAFAGPLPAPPFVVDLPATIVDVLGTGFVIDSPDLPGGGGQVSGTARIDLTTLVGTTLGLEFALGADVGDPSLDSTVTISNLRLQQIPVPGTAVLMLAGLLGGLAAHRVLHRFGPFGPFESPPADCIRGWPWSGGSWRCGNRPRRTGVFGSSPRSSARRSR